MHPTRERHFRRFISPNVLIFLGMVVVAYQLFTYAKKVYQDYQIDLQIAQYEQDISDLKIQNEEMRSVIEYLQTDAYREKIAKGVAGLKNPGEEVIIVKGQNPFSSQPTVPSENVIPQYALTNMQKWWEYFFGTRPTKPPTTNLNDTTLN